MGTDGFSRGRLKDGRRDEPDGERVTPMFVQYFTHVDVPMALVEKRISQSLSSFEGWAGVSYRAGEDLRATVGPTYPGFAKEVHLDIGHGEVQRAGVVHQVTWTATRAEILFPTLNADLIVTAVASTRTKLCLAGSYEPPLGNVGRAIDRLALKNLAEATVQDWVDRVADAVSSADLVI